MIIEGWGLNKNTLFYKNDMYNINSSIEYSEEERLFETNIV